MFFFGGLDFGMLLFCYGDKFGYECGFVVVVCCLFIVKFVLS